MGILISRFRRSKTSLDVLERLENEIKNLEQDGQSHEQRRKRILGYILVYSIGIYVLWALVYYFMYLGTTQNWAESLFNASPLMLLPVVMILLRACISYYYNWLLTKNRIKLSKMRGEKKKLLEEVMNTETYKIAKEILDKFGNPDDSAAIKPFVRKENVDNANNTVLPANPTPVQLRQRQLAYQTTSPGANLVPINSSTPLTGNKALQLKSDILPRPILERNRSALDRVVDFLLKDGPNYRMALICSECHSHNGMALEEEFEYFSYSCAYCGKFNPARKRRPTAPMLTLERALPYSPRQAIGSPPPKTIKNSSEEESSALSSASDSENEIDKNTMEDKETTGKERSRPSSPNKKDN